MNVGEVIGSVDAERPPEALGERRLAGAHLAGEHDHVAGRLSAASARGDGVVRRASDASAERCGA